MSTNEAETRARTMGWLPKDKFKGPPEHWMPADKYLERGDSILPILQANNRELADKVNRVDGENAQLKQQLKDATEAIEGLKEFRSTITKEKATEQKKEIAKAIVQARADGDVDAEVELTGKLGEVTAAIKEAEKPPVKKIEPTTTQGPQLNAEAQAWMKANPWFGQDKRKTGYAQGLRDEWVGQGKPVSTPEFFAFMDAEMEKQFDQNAQRRGTQKVDGTNNSSGGDGSAGRTYADLPPEAKKACDAMEKKVMGPNKAYKTKADWQAAYLSQYDWS
jgi:hypothetical protein